MNFSIESLEELLTPPEDGVVTCGDCENDFSPDESEWPTICQDCGEEQRRSNANSQYGEALERNRERWNGIVLPLYADTEINHTTFNLPLWRSVEDWSPRDGMGVGLVGPSGSSKTRIAYLLLEKSCMESRTIAAVPAREFVHLSQGQFRNNGENGFSRKLKQWESADLLLVDGLDRVTKWSERTEGDLAGLLECRHERKHAVIWTTNAPSEHLWSRFPRGRQSPVATTLTQSTQIWAG